MKLEVLYFVPESGLIGYFYIEHYKFISGLIFNAVDLKNSVLITYIRHISAHWVVHYASKQKLYEKFIAFGRSGFTMTLSLYAFHIILMVNGRNRNQDFLHRKQAFSQLDYLQLLLYLL